VLQNHRSTMQRCMTPQTRQTHMRLRLICGIDPFYIG